MRIVAALLGLLALAACGADGDPVRPTAAVEVGFGSDGADIGGVVGVSDGPVSVGIGF